MKLKNSNGDKTQKLKFLWNSKTQIVIQPKNSNCDQTQKLKLWQNSITLIVIKLQNSNGYKTFNSNCDKTQ